MRTRQEGGPHGEAFAYKTVNTDALGAVMRRVTGKPVSELLRERIFGQLGVEQDAYFAVDPTGAEFAGGGLNLTLRDMARFGEMMRLGWPIQRSADRAEKRSSTISGVAATARIRGAGYTMLPGWSYRNMWWMSHNAHGAFTGTRDPRTGDLHRSWPRW